MAAENALSNVMTCFIDNLDLVSRQLEDGDSKRNDAGDCDKDKFWDKLQKSVKAVSNEVTELSVMFSKPPVPSVEHCEPMVKRVECATLSMVSASYGLPKSQGLMLRRHINRAVVDVVKSIISFAATLRNNTVGSPYQLRSTKRVWQKTDAFRTIPKDNREAVLTVLRDTYGEVKSSEETMVMVVENGQRDYLNYHSDDVIDDAMLWPDKDIGIVYACFGLTRVTQTSLEKSREAVEKNSECDNDAKIAQLDDLADHMERLSPLVRDLFRTLYTPIETENSVVNAQKLAEKVKTGLLFLRQSQLTDEEDSQGLEFLISDSQHNMDEITAAIQNS